MVLVSATFVQERRRLVDRAAKDRLPAVYPARAFVDAGGLMSYGPNVLDQFRRAATYVHKILKTDGGRGGMISPISGNSVPGDPLRIREAPRPGLHRGAGPGRAILWSGLPFQRPAQLVQVVVVVPRQHRHDRVDC